MDNEQLRMVLDALTQMGEGGKDAFVLWLVMDKLVPAVAWIITLVVVVLAILKLVKDTVLENEPSRYFRTVRDRYNLGQPGPLIASETKKVMTLLDSALEVADAE